MPVRREWHGKFGAVRASLERLYEISKLAQIKGTIHTVECCVHTAQIHQQANHGHISCRLMFRQQLVPQYLASLTTSSHCIDVQICESLLANRIRLVAVRKDGLIILEDIL